jgi:hypothetical protein
MKERIIFATKFVVLLFAICIKTSAQNCFECDGNSVNGRKSSAFGFGNTASGDTAFVAGGFSTVSGKYSFVAGKNSSATMPYASVIGSWSSASGGHSFVLGSYSRAQGNSSYVVGNNSVAEHDFSLALGHNLKASGGGFVIGNGKVDAILTNKFDNSLMIGFNSDKPTLFVSETRYGNQSGNVGIGNITDPQAKLHILADVNEHATLKIETISNDRISQIDFGNYFFISAGKNENMGFHTPAGKNFVFNNGNVGVGTMIPNEKLDVNGNVRISGSENSLLFDGTQSGRIVFNRGSGNIGIMDERHSLNFFTGEGINRMTIVGENGNVGIGTGDPQANLHILKTSSGSIATWEKISNDAGGAAQNYMKARGTLNAKTAILNNDIIGGLTAQGYTGNDYSTAAAIIIKADGNFSASSSGGYIVFQTREQNDTKPLQDRLTIRHDGRIGIGIGESIPSEQLHVNGNIRIDRVVLNNPDSHTDFIKASYEPLIYGSRAGGEIPGGSNGLILQTGGAGDSCHIFLRTADQTRLFISNNGKVGIGTDNPKSKLQVHGTLSVGYDTHNPDNVNNLIVEGNVGIGTFAPGEKLDVNGKIKTKQLQITENYNAGFLLLSDASGNAIWTNPESITNIGPWSRQGDNVFVEGFKKVGIGTSQPQEALHVNGNILLGNNGNIKGHRTGWEWFNIFAGSDENDAYISMHSRLNQAGSIKLYCKGEEGRIEFHNENIQVMSIRADNNVYFGDPDPEKSSNLYVNGQIRANLVRVNTDTWSDYVFAPDYNLRPLHELSSFITKNGHLPDIPAEAEVLENGIDLGEMNGLLLKKIEELTLYLLEQDSKINILQTELQQIKNEGRNN